MKDLSFHILDIVRNAVNAGARRIEIAMEESTARDTLVLTITDDGSGMTAEVVERVRDPFFTSSVTKRVGLGIPLLEQNAELTGGSCTIVSEPGKGTQVTALFHPGHIDMIPAGDLTATMRTLIATGGRTDFSFRIQKDGEGFEIDTADLRRELELDDLRNRDVLDYISAFISSSLQELNTKQHNNNVS
jgi:hypothetical protein